MNEHRPKVLIADDVPENIDILFASLRDQYAVVAARDGEKALQIARKQPYPDLILLDVMMPRMDGYEVCRRLKADPELARIPVMFITALDGMDDESLGLTLGAVDYITKPFRPEMVRLRVANQLELKRHRDHLEELVAERTAELALTQDLAIYTLSDVIEARDPETGGHIQRTRTYVRLLATRLRDHPRFAAGLDDRVIDLLYKSAPLHDIGKVGVPDAILRKPGSLTPDELAEMRRHPIYGRDAMARAVARLGEGSFLRYAQEIAYTHHERWDGSGYPQGLQGDAIPLSGRLMALADVYDALISRRPYKPPFPHDQAVAIIIEGKGSHFDPAVVEAFVALQGEFRRVALELADSEEEREVLREG